MSWRSYQNEIIFIVALLLFLGALVYKYSERANWFSSTQDKQLEYKELKRVVELQKIWGNPKIGKKVDKIKTFVTDDKITWKKEHKKLNASFKRLSPYELNKVIGEIINLPVVIRKLQIKKAGNFYEMEYQCSW